MDAERFNIGPLVRAHFGTLIPAGKRTMSFSSWALLVILPALLAAGTVGWGVKFPASGIAPLLTATGLMIGAFISAFVLLTNLRIKIRESDDWSYRVKLARLIGSTAASCLYAASVSFVVVAGLVVGVSVPLFREDPYQVGATALLFAVMCHLGATFATVIRRLFGVYFSLFASDFNVELSLVSGTAATTKKHAKGQRSA